MTKRLILAILLGTMILAGNVSGQDSTSLSPETAGMDLKQALMRRPVSLPSIEVLPSGRFCVKIIPRLWAASVGAGMGHGWDCELVLQKCVWLYGSYVSSYSSSSSYLAIQPVLRFRWPANNCAGSILFAEAAYRHPLRHDQRQANLTMGCARRLGPKYLLFSNIFLSYPKAVSLGGGISWHSNRSAADFGLYAGAGRGRGVPIDFRWGYRIRIWRTVFFEIRDRTTITPYMSEDLSPVYDQSGNFIRFETEKELDAKIHQNYDGYLGILF